MAVVCVASVAPFAGVLFTAQPGTAGGTGPGADGGSVMGTAAVVKLPVFVAAQPAAEPLVFFGTTNQLYKVDAIRPVMLSLVSVVLLVGDAGTVDPVHTYTS